MYYCLQPSRTIFHPASNAKHLLQLARKVEPSGIYCAARGTPQGATEALQAHTPPHPAAPCPCHPAFGTVVLDGHLARVQIITPEQKQTAGRRDRNCLFPPILELMLFVMYLHYLNNRGLIPTLIFLWAVNIVENYT